MYSIEHACAPLDETEDLLFKEYNLAMHLQRVIFMFAQAKHRDMASLVAKGKIPTPLQLAHEIQSNKDKCSSISIHVSPPNFEIMVTLKVLESADLYTVGWIAALVIERAAATAMLDERHDQPGTFTQYPADSNVYTWGKMGKHNIVIASLPVGVYETVSAAATAMSMLSSLPQIKISLFGRNWWWHFTAYRRS